MKEGQIMDFITLAKNRYSVRSYSEKQIEKDKINKILEAAYISPSAKNKQSARVYVVQSEGGIEKLRALTRCVYPVVPPKTEYSITERGKSLTEVIDSIRDWGRNYMSGTFEE